ncbi:hypothetical protein BDDG_12623 [Blastomyces dermatitidis ATCC 18188]|uniref:Uncharacterized protein n=1 Tax=Ajellomyces dermatitidis (strain ATCC 18188 / CBS 674.68) TaxID=653446 RepID=A0A0J9EQ67_AJEDA|nr:hypothetical protein BDDG_12623 [Blastomyces dermatitidis ATCC 18188]
MMMRETEDELNADVSAGRRNDISLQGTATTAAVTREAGEDVIIEVMLPRLINTTVFNLAFLTVTETAATP